MSLRFLGALVVDDAFLVDERVEAPGGDGMRSGRGAGDVQECHTELLLLGDERAGAADYRRRD